MKKIENQIIRIESIKPNFKNPRNPKTLTPQDLKELKDNMEKFGQLTPIKLDENNMVLAGHRRIEAAKELGWETLKADIITGLTDFEKSAILISDNTTQRELNTWECRKLINDLYWNEFSQEYNFDTKNPSDKGFKVFAQSLGVDSGTIGRIIRSLSKENIKNTLRLEKAGLSTSVTDLIVSCPRRIRQEMTNEAIRLSKEEPDKPVREILRRKKQILLAEDEDGFLYPSFYARVLRKIESVAADLPDVVIQKTEINAKIDIVKAIEKHILPLHSKLKKQIN